MLSKSPIVRLISCNRGVKMNCVKKYLVFISSTYTDLINPRKKVIDAVLSMNQIPIGMEMFSAGNEAQWTIIKQNIDLSDYYVLVVGQRYGSLSEDGIGYTEKEYDYAKEKGVPILAFIKDRNCPTTPSERENDPDLQNKLDNFVSKVIDGKLCDFWSNEDELAAKISIALMKSFVDNQRPGWIRGDNVLGKQSNSAELSLNLNIANFLLDKKLQGLKDITIKSYEIELSIFNKYFSDSLINEIDTKDIIRYVTHREKNYNINSKNSTERIRVILNTFFGWLVNQDKIKSNPIDAIKSSGKLYNRLETLEEYELKEIRKACKSPRERALIELLLSTGCKLGEIAKIKLSDIDWDQEIININRSDNVSRVVLFNKEAQKYVKCYIESRVHNINYLFTGERKPYKPLSNRGIQREITLIVSRTAIIKNVNASTFRNTFIKGLMEKGVPINVLKSLLGHKAFSSTLNSFWKLSL